MEPGARLTLLKELASRLAELPWDEIDLTLRQFGLPSDIPGDYANSTYRYALACLEGGDNDRLLSLYEFHAGRPFSRTPTMAQAAASWEPGLFRLFLTHVSAHKAFVADVKRGLLLHGIDGFVAHQDIEPTKEWVGEIELALETCDALAAFLTSDFHDSKWTDQEIGYCIKRRVLIVPICLGLDPYGFIARYQGLRAIGLDAQAISTAVFEILVEHDLTSARIAEPLVSQFRNSKSFAAAKRNMTLVEKVKVWTPQLLRQLEEAVESNFEVKEAFGVPARVRAIVDSYSK